MKRRLQTMLHGKIFISKYHTDPITNDKERTTRKMEEEIIDK